MERLTSEALGLAVSMIDHPRWGGAGWKTRATFHVQHETAGNPDAAGGRLVPLSSRYMARVTGMNRRRLVEALAALEAERVLIRYPGAGTRGTAWEVEPDVARWRVPWAVERDVAVRRLQLVAGQVDPAPETLVARYGGTTISASGAGSDVLVARIPAPLEALRGALVARHGGTTIPASGAGPDVLPARIPAPLEPAADAAGAGVSLATSERPIYLGREGAQTVLEALKRKAQAPVFGSMARRVVAAAAVPGFDAGQVVEQIDRYPGLPLVEALVQLVELAARAPAASASRSPASYYQGEPPATPEQLEAAREALAAMRRPGNGPWPYSDDGAGLGTEAPGRPAPTPTEVAP